MQHRRLGAGVVEVDAAQLEPRRGRAAAGPGRSGWTTEDSVSRTSCDAAGGDRARGIIVAMKVAIMTDMRIWTR